jgi:protein O-mannosyl-transferase
MDRDIGKKWGWYLALICLPMAVYLNSLQNPFHYDDIHSIVDNPHIRQLGNIPGFFVDPTLFSAQVGNAMFRPLLLTTFAVNYAISGYDVWSYHLVGMLLHAGCVLLIYGIGRHLLKDDLAAGFGALIFGLHPINSESINYISSRSEVLAGFFILLGFLGFLRFRDRRSGLILVVGAFAAGLLSKSTVVVLPALLLAWNLVFEREGLRKNGKLFGLLGGVFALYLGAIWKFLKKATVGEPVRSYSEQIWTQVKAGVFYLKLLLWPSGLSVDHQFLISDSLFDPFAASAFLFLISLAWLSWYHRQKHPLPLFLLIWFFIALAPASLVPLNVLVNEHRLYVPSAAFGLVVAYFFYLLRSRGGTWIRGAEVGTLVILVACAWATWERNQVWKDEYSLWGDAAAKGELMARPFIFLGENFARDGRDKDALYAFEKVVQRDPGFSPAYAALGKLYRENGQVKKAEIVLRKGVDVDPKNPDLWEGLGEVYHGKGRWDECVEAYGKAVGLRPEDDGLHNNLGNAYQMAGKGREALAHHRRALEINPEDARTYLNFGNASLMLGEFQDALEGYRRAVELDPQFAGAWLSLGNLHERLGQVRAALDAYERAVELDPQFARAWLSLGNLHEQLGQVRAALDAYERAEAIDPGYSGFVEERRRILKGVGE